MNELSIYWITDPGHGWLAVPMAEVQRTGIRPSEFSFISDDSQTAFLEEDCDAGLYLEEALSPAAAGAIPVRYVDEFRRPQGRFPAVQS